MTGRNINNDIDIIISQNNRRNDVNTRGDKINFD